jgi:hypothetical protein
MMITTTMMSIRVKPAIRGAVRRLQRPPHCGLPALLTSRTSKTLFMVLRSLVMVSPEKPHLRERPGLKRADHNKLTRRIP